MMILTNKYGLPETIFKAVQLDTHRVAGDISVSQLVDSPQIRILKKKHNYEVDVSDMLDALIGTALHNVLERASIDSVRKHAFILTMETLLAKAKSVGDEKKKEGMMKVINYLKACTDAFFKEDDRFLVEQTIQMEVMGTMLYGTFDVLDLLKQSLEDYKSTSVYNWIYPDARKKWKAQTNIYAHMAIANGLPVKQIRINAFFKDWNNSNMLRNKDYPSRKIMSVEVPLLSPEQRINYINARMKLHLQAEEGNMPLCTGEERWATADEWAVKLNQQAKKAHRKFPTEAEAVSYCEENRHKNRSIYVEFRPGESRRCASYCPVSQFCEQRKLELKLRMEKGIA